MTASREVCLLPGRHIHRLIASSATNAITGIRISVFFPRLATLPASD